MTNGNVVTFTFRAFSRRFCPKQFTISSSVTRKKPQHVTADKVKSNNLLELKSYFFNVTNKIYVDY